MPKTPGQAPFYFRSWHCNCSDCRADASSGRRPSAGGFEGFRASHWSHRPVEPRRRFIKISWHCFVDPSRLMRSSLISGDGSSQVTCLHRRLGFWSSRHSWESRGNSMLQPFKKEVSSDSRGSEKEEMTSELAQRCFFPAQKSRYFSMGMARLPYHLGTSVVSSPESASKSGSSSSLPGGQACTTDWRKTSAKESNKRYIFPGIQRQLKTCLTWFRHVKSVKPWLFW